MEPTTKRQDFSTILKRDGVKEKASACAAAATARCEGGLKKVLKNCQSERRNLTIVNCK